MYKDKSMRKQNIINLVKYYAEKNDSAFRNEVSEIASDFTAAGQEDLGSYLMELISTTNFYVPQNNYTNLVFLHKKQFNNESLFLPDEIKDDVLGIVKSVDKKIPISKVIFYGKPGSGKTESAYQIARLLNRDLLTVSMEELIDSHLGQTSKNIVQLFSEIKRLYSTKVVILFDELDAIVMNRSDSRDLREMGRVTSTFLKELDELHSDILLIATTNLISAFDKALLRRFDAKISFDKYSREDLISVANCLLQKYIKKTETSKSDLRLFEKLLKNLDAIPYPGDMKQIIKISLAFSDETSEYDYFARLYRELYGKKATVEDLLPKGYTTREIEILTGVSKSKVSRINKEI